MKSRKGYLITKTKNRKRGTRIETRKPRNQQLLKTRDKSVFKLSDSEE